MTHCESAKLTPETQKIVSNSKEKEIITAIRHFIDDSLPDLMAGIP